MIVIAFARCVPEDAKGRECIELDQLGAREENTGDVLRRESLADAVFALVAFEEILRVYGTAFEEGWAEERGRVRESRDIHHADTPFCNMGVCPISSISEVRLKRPARVVVEPLFLEIPESLFHNPVDFVLMSQPNDCTNHLKHRLIARRPK